MRPRPGRPRAGALACLLLLALSAGLGAQGRPGSRRDFVYRLRLEPENPLVGGLLVAVLEIEGLEGARLAALELDGGLSLESSLLRPAVDAGGRRGSELRLELRVLEAGFRRVEGLRVEGREGLLELGPFGFEARGQASSGRPGPSYRWVFPEKVLRYAAFPLALQALDGSSAGAAATFPLPEGLVLESLGEAGGRASRAWLATALEEGEILLPAAEIGEGRAEPSLLRVLPLPAAIGESRAQGDFELSLEGPPSARAGDRLFFRLLLSGRGNLPSLRLPRVELRQGGGVLPAAALELRRIDALRPGAGVYEGSSILEISLLAPEAGLLSLEVAPFPVLGSDGELRRLRVPPFVLRVEAAAANAGPEPGGSLLQGLAEAAAARLSASGAAGQDAEKARERGQDETLVQAGALWRSGEKGEGLALLLRLARRGDNRKELRAAATEASESLGAGPPLLDRLPGPGLAALIGAPALGTAILAFLCSRKARKAGPRGFFLLLGILLSALALGSAFLGFASLREGRREYAVVWSERLLAVPSERAEGGLSLVPGQSGLVIGRAPGYLGLRFPDGSVGWVSLDSVYSY